MLMGATCREVAAERAARSRLWVKMLLIDDVIDALAKDQVDVMPHAADAIKDEGLQLADVLKAISRTTPYTRNLSRDRGTARLIVLPGIEGRTYEVILARQVGAERIAMVTVTEHHDEHYRRHGRGVLDINGDWVFDFDPSGLTQVA